MDAVDGLAAVVQLGRLGLEVNDDLGGGGGDEVNTGGIDGQFLGFLLAVWEVRTTCAGLCVTVRRTRLRVAGRTATRSRIVAFCESSCAAAGAARAQVVLGIIAGQAGRDPEMPSRLVGITAPGFEYGQQERAGAGEGHQAWVGIGRQGLGQCNLHQHCGGDLVGVGQEAEHLGPFRRCL